MPVAYSVYVPHVAAEGFILMAQTLGPSDPNDGKDRSWLTSNGVIYPSTEARGFSYAKSYIVASCV